MTPLFLCLAAFFHDGDNIRCDGRTMRLAAIDAPDFLSSPKCHQHRTDVWCDQAAAERSRDHLRAFVGDDPVTCRVVDANPRTRRFDWTDRYGRPVVRCSVRGQDLGTEQLRSHNAVAWPLPKRKR